jgi:hypothetical protein
MPTTDFTRNFNEPSRILTATLSNAQPTNFTYANNTTTGGGVGLCFPPQMSSTLTSPGHAIKMDAALLGSVMPYSKS